jgi:hypothetical protein
MRRKSLSKAFVHFFQVRQAPNSLTFAHCIVASLVPVASAHAYYHKPLHPVCCCGQLAHLGMLAVCSDFAPECVYLVWSACAIEYAVCCYCLHPFLLRQAASGGHVQAQFNVAMMHLAGKGTQRSCKPALTNLKALVEKGPQAAALQGAHEAFFRGHHNQVRLVRAPCRAPCCCHRGSRLGGWQVAYP